MRHARHFALIGLAALAAATLAFAQSVVEPLADQAAVTVVELEDSIFQALAESKPGDPEAGAAKAGLCAACHGMDGNPMDGMPYPRIAGQSERFIAHELALFKSGQRTTGMALAMVPFASELSAQDMRDLGAFFESQATAAGIADDTPITDNGPYKDLAFYQIGEQLYRGGDPARGIPACLACHGPSGAGNPGPAYPSVAGQEAGYVQTRLHEYRAGVPEAQDARLFQIMATVASALTDQEIAALASYLQGLHRAPDARARAAIAAAQSANSGQ